MKARTTMIGLLAAMLLTFVAAQAHAKASVVCAEKKNNSIDHKGVDGSECFASSDGKGKSHSSASGDKSFADAEVNSGGLQFLIDHFWTRKFERFQNNRLLSAYRGS